MRGVAVTELQAAYQDARDTTEREDVARVIARLTPGSSTSLAEMAAAALAEARTGR